MNEKDSNEDQMNEFNNLSLTEWRPTEASGRFIREKLRGLWNPCPVICNRQRRRAKGNQPLWRFNPCGLI
jgi:hypothetical protein